ncbi:MAG: hypothetical protein KF872_09625 [Chitinophagales bacterium]|nr:hypothetical protein [Chitinophagales bacterium]
MTTKQIDILNIALIAIALAASFLLPFEVFLFSYAVLGPLHYLTEITWLHQRNYFTTDKTDFVWLTVLCAFTTLFTIFFSDYSNWAVLLIYTAFMASLTMVLFKELWKKLVFTFIAFLIGTTLLSTPPFFLLFAILLPTLIHVFIFTGLFMLSGTLKSKSIYGALSVLVFILAAILCFTYTPQFPWYKISAYAEKNMIEIGFLSVNQAVFSVFKLGESTKDAVLNSAIGLGVMRFIAFAYTYHYLNWFSKTSVIKWHKVPRTWLATVVTLWLLSIGVYAYDYKTGLITLYALSMIHVYLEFPLNFRSVGDIGKNLRLLFSPN